MQPAPLAQTPPAPVPVMALTGGPCPPLDDLDLTSAYPVGNVAELRRLRDALGPSRAPWRS